MDNVSLTIKKIRLANNLTQKQMADSMGVTQSYISRIEQNREIPSKTFVMLFSIKYVDILNVENIGGRIKTIRQSYNLSTSQFAMQLGVTDDTIIQIENNVTILNDTLLKLIAYLYKVDEYWIRTGDTNATA